MIHQWKIKYQDSDFLVHEVSLQPEYKKISESTYSYIWVTKRGYTTFEVIDLIGEFLEIDRHEVAVQGLKDEDGITSQLMSVKVILEESDIARFNKRAGGGSRWVRIDRVNGFGDKHVQAKKLHGNVFTITLRNFKQQPAENLEKHLAANKNFTYINYYDNQRFGLPGGPYVTHLIGKEIVEGNWKGAFEYYVQSGNHKNEQDVHGRLKIVGGYESFFRSLDRRKVKFFISAHNSMLWNLAVSSMLMETGVGALKKFEHIGALAVPICSKQALPSLCSCKGFEYDEGYNSVISQPINRSVIGTTKLFFLDSSDDELHPGMKKVVLSFMLPTGSYATMVIKQLMEYVDSQG
ncbi:tRNA pseudouridine(13) synthase TruD [Candidatus Uhrbacteria bacterium]|jgi:tRNA pseudouridine13 synthase|nr:tRNA pseudouridine(13) synthase TruD [Candidatus Uhrbacteria bacterium]MBT7716996.1 tRNA pseudouridine(13) synthase TruD [Candidatus Uhrbacteria bacterium]